MDFEYTVNGQDQIVKSIEDPQGDPFSDVRVEWATKLESRAREVFGSDPDRIVFRYYSDGIRLAVDSKSKIAVAQAIREEFDHMPARAQAFCLDVMRMLERT